MKALAGTLVILVLVAGCTHKYKSDSFHPPTKQISTEGSAFILTAKDGSYGSKIYPGSGRMLTHATQVAVSRFLNHVEIAQGFNSREEAFVQARSKNISYVFEPTILNWEDRSTEWSGRPDRIAIKIVVWDPVSGKTLASGTERASSKWGTFGGDHPPDLLPRALENFTTRLFR